MNGRVCSLRKSQLGVSQMWHHCGISANLPLSVWSVCLCDKQQTLNFTSRHPLLLIQHRFNETLCHSTLFFYNVFYIKDTNYFMEVYYSNTKLAVSKQKTKIIVLTIATIEKRHIFLSLLTHTRTIGLMFNLTAQHWHLLDLPNKSQTLLFVKKNVHSTHYTL